MQVNSGNVYSDRYYSHTQVTQSPMRMINAGIAVRNWFSVVQGGTRSTWLAVSQSQQNGSTIEALYERNGSLACIQQITNTFVASYRYAPKCRRWWCWCAGSQQALTPPSWQLQVQYLHQQGGSVFQALIMRVVYGSSDGSQSNNRVWYAAGGTIIKFPSGWLV